MGKGITQFCREVLDPAIFERLDQVFPQMEFSRNGSVWFSKHHLDGSLSSTHNNRTRVQQKNPNRAFPIDQDERGFLGAGKGVDLITLYKSLNGLGSDIDAILSICHRIGITPPTNEDSAKYEAYAKKRETLESINAKMRSALYSPEGKEVLAYLHNERGYTDEFIEFAELGYCSEAIARELAPLMEYVDRDGVLHAMSRSIGVKEWKDKDGQIKPGYIFSFPFRTLGRLHGFNFRALDSTAKPKYKNAFISYDATKKYNLFGLTYLKPIDGREWNKNIVIVEGELDALRAQFVGISNVVACTGGTIYPEALQEAKRMGAKGAILLFDIDKDESGRADTIRKTKTAIGTLIAEGLAPFVATFPVLPIGQKEDVDSYLKTHTGEELVSVINSAETGGIWSYIQLSEEWARKMNETGGASYVIDEFKRRTIELCNDKSLVSPTDRDMILDLFSRHTNRFITKESIAEEANRVRAIADSARQKNDTITLLSSAYQLATSTDPEGVRKALSSLSEKVDELRNITASDDYDKYLLTPSGHGLREDYSNAPEGIATSYAFGVGEHQQRLILQGGALTYVCAQPSHGKTAMLINLALDAVKAGGSGSVLYFTYEEPLKDLKLRFLNTLVGCDVSRGNRNSLKSYFRTGSSQYFSGQALPHCVKEAEDKLSFYLSTGALRLFREKVDSRELMTIIRYITKNTSVKAVFLDYIQLLHTDGYKGERRIELMRICEELIELATETELPIIIGSQLNRDAKSPIEMTAQNISESSSIEHSANTIIQLWNSNTPVLEGSRYYETKRSGQDTYKVECAEALSLKERGFTPGVPGTITARLTKNRDGERNIDAVFKFHGNSGKITQPDYTPPTGKEAERTGNLFNQAPPANDTQVNNIFPF